MTARATLRGITNIGRRLNSVDADSSQVGPSQYEVVVRITSMILVGFLFLATAQPIATACTHALLPARSLELVRPLMQLRKTEVDDELTEDGHWKRTSPLEEEVDEIFEKILGNRSEAGDEAVVYLLHVYLGEHRGEQLVCEVTNRGKKLLPLIRKYEECTPATGLEPYSKWIATKESQSAFAVQQITSGGACELEQ